MHLTLSAMPYVGQRLCVLCGLKMFISWLRWSKRTTFLFYQPMVEHETFKRHPGSFRFCFSTKNQAAVVIEAASGFGTCKETTSLQVKFREGSDRTLNRTNSNMNSGTYQFERTHISISIQPCHKDVCCF